MRFNIHEAKTNFSKLVAAVEAGEKVTICRNGKPVIDCVPARPTKCFPFGDWGPPKKRAATDPDDDSHLVGPTDDELLDDMRL